MVKQGLNSVCHTYLDGTNCIHNNTRCDFGIVEQLIWAYTAMIQWTLCHMFDLSTSCPTITKSRTRKHVQTISHCIFEHIIMTLLYLDRPSSGISSKRILIIKKLMQGHSFFGQYNINNVVILEILYFGNLLYYCYLQVLQFDNSIFLFNVSHWIKYVKAECE